MTSNNILAHSLSHRIELVQPAAIEFGCGAVEALARFVDARGFRRPLVIADSFNEARIGLLKVSGDIAVFGDIKAEPDIPSLERALAVAERAEPDVVIGFGGGSAMDLAKLVAVLPGSGQTIHDVVGPEKVRHRKVGLVQVPTTSGTGSEVGTRSLVTDPATRNKLAVQSRLMLADLAVVDPDLTVSVPPVVTAATGLDALTHCVEAFTSRKSHPTIDLYALEGARLVGRFLPRAVQDVSDREARTGLSLASLYGGLCLGPVNTTAGHAIAYPLGTRHHIPHGLACAVIFPHAFAFNAEAVPDKTAAILQSLGLVAPIDEQAIVQAVSHWCSELGIQMSMSQLGVPENDLGVMADEAHAIRRLLDNNPRDVSRDQILAMYRNAF